MAQHVLHQPDVSTIFVHKSHRGMAKKIACPGFLVPARRTYLDTIRVSWCSRYLAPLLSKNMQAEHPV